MGKKPRPKKSAIDTQKPGAKSELKKTFGDTLHDEVKKQALKIEVQGVQARRNQAIAQGTGGEDNERFKEDYRSGFELSKIKKPKEGKESKKYANSNTYLEKVSESVEYEPKNKGLTK